MEFYWGAATSAYQVGGGINNDWSAVGMDAGIAANHYFLFEKDFDLAKSLGHNAHRFSIEWARIAAFALIRSSKIRFSWL